jgi:type IV pilus assembly protein PilV
MLNIKNRSVLGVGMVEVLVAVVVIGVGMLGIASLYVTTLQAKTTALSRLKAVNLAYDIADRIRANPMAGNAYALADTTTLTAPSQTCLAADCTPAQIAAADLYAWSNQVTNSANGLPGGSYVKRRISFTGRTATTPQIFKIELVWREASTASSDLTYSMTVQAP